jgi:hypothetical protein
VPGVIRDGAFLLILPIAFKSKKDYFWIAYFFILEDAPGGMFTGSTRDALYRLPLYSLGPGMSINIREVFYIIILIKAILIKWNNPSRGNTYFKPQLKALLVLFICIVSISPVMGMNNLSISFMMHAAINCTIFYWVFILIPDEKSFRKFLMLLFPMVFIALSLQLYDLLNNHQLVSLLDSNRSSVQGVFLDPTQTAIPFDDVVRPMELDHTMLLCFIGSLFYLYYDKANLSRFFLILVNILSFISIFIMATRSWFIATTVAYLIYFFSSTKRGKPYLTVGILVVSILAIVSFFIPTITEQIGSAWSRIASIESLRSGDLSMGGTAVRYDYRLPLLMEAFYKSTIILGAGFSDLYRNSYDYHVGYNNILFNVGIVGSIVFFALFFKIFSVVISKNKYYQGNYPKIKIIASISFVILLIINAASQIIGFVIFNTDYVVQAFVLLLLNFAYITYAQGCPKNQKQKRKLGFLEFPHLGNANVADKQTQIIANE